MGLIDADALQEEYVRLSGRELSLINDASTIDAVPVKHGYWKSTPTAWIYCSVCGSEPPNETNIATPYCPNCGAKMEKNL